MSVHWSHLLVGFCALMLSACSFDLFGAHQGLVNRDVTDVRAGFPNLDPHEVRVRCGGSRCDVGEQCLRCDLISNPGQCLPATERPLRHCDEDFLARHCDDHDDCGSSRLCIYRQLSPGASVACEIPDPRSDCTEKATIVCSDDLDCRRCRNKARCVSASVGVKLCLPSNGS